MASQEGGEEGKKAGHPQLRVLRRDRYTHGLQPAQMEALRAMCDAFIPSLPDDADSAGEEGGRGDGPRGGGKDLERFYLASGADSSIPDDVAELAVTRCVWEAVVLLRVILWLLSTRLGTLALCGRLCLAPGGGFPYVRRFADMAAESQEKALPVIRTASYHFGHRVARTS